MLNILCIAYAPSVYPINMQYSYCKHVFSIILENIVDPDQMTSSETSCSGSTLSSTGQWLLYLYLSTVPFLVYSIIIVKSCCQSERAVLHAVYLAIFCLQASRQYSN